MLKKISLIINKDRFGEDVTIDVFYKMGLQDIEIEAIKYIDIRYEKDELYQLKDFEKIKVAFLRLLRKKEKI